MSHWRGADEIQARLRGPVNPLPTKFTPDGEIDPDGMRATIDVSLDAGVEVIMLTWGETLVSLLTDDELAAVHRIVIDHVGRRAVTIACDAMWGLNKAREFGAYVDELGFDLFMARPAEWARGTPESLADWYRGVAQQTRVMFVGNVPLRTCEMVEDEPNLLAFKEDIDLAYAHEVLMRWGDRWPMTGGGGMKRHHLLWPHGCRSWLDVFVRSYPEPAMTYWDAVQRGDDTTAWDAIDRSELAIGPLVAACRVGGNGFFASMGEAHGVSPRWRRSPAPNATDEEIAALRDALQALNLA